MQARGSTRGSIAASVADAVQSIRRRSDLSPPTAIVLGSGLGGLAEQIEDPVAISYGDIPGFSESSSVGHRGELIIGRIEGHEVVVMAGRLHRYEGLSIDQVAFPIRVMAALGSTRLIISNAAGGLKPTVRVGDVVVIADHINWLGSVGPAQPCEPVIPGLRRGDVYDHQLARLAMRVALARGVRAVLGTYLATTGPSYETRSEIRMMRRFGADVVGMSTAPEAQAGASEKMRVLGISLVTNVANPDRRVKADHLEVVEAGRAAQTKMGSLVRGVLDCDRRPD